MRQLMLMGLAVLAVGFFATGAAQAQATRTWVSGVGDDANPCSRTAPCKTFAGAISKTVAGGEIDVLDPGGFGGLTITKSITIDGNAGTVAGVLVAGTNGITVAAGITDVVVLRNLSFQGLVGNGTGPNPGLTGIAFNSGAALVAENVDVTGFQNWGINFTPSSAASLYVTNSRFSNNGTTGGGGIEVQPQSGATATKAVINSVLIANSRAGITIDGEFTTGATTVAVENSVSSGNQKAGVTASTSMGSVTLTLDHVVANNNGSVGVQSVGAGSIVYLGNSTITGNKNGVVAVTSGQVLSYKNNEISGNTTSDGTPLTAAPGPLN